MEKKPRVGGEAGTATRLRRRGSVIIQLCVVLVVLLGFVALTTDYGIQVVRQRRLQGVTDAAALAAGPDLVRSGAGAATTAVNYASFNNVTIPTPAVANQTITVTAAEVVATPFARVLNANWGTATVHAVSVVRATKAVDSAFLRPLAVPCGPYGIPNVDKVIGQPLHLRLTLQNNGRKYSDTPADVQADTINVLPIDLHANGSVTDYKDSLKFGMSGDLAYDAKGQASWLASLMFLAAKQNSDSDWAANLAAWQLATYEAVVTDADSILNRAGGAYANDAWDHFQPGNPRYMVMLEVNRDTAGPNKTYDTQFKGYVGFYIEGMDYDSATHTAQINGRFVTPATRSRRVPTSLPDGINDGVYSFSLIQ
ncbi:MAG TPA: pilus assembly protein TadG-related protein [Armatimonadota bacterium]